MVGVWDDQGMRAYRIQAKAKKYGLVTPGKRIFYG
jgi:hypothetical protein